MAGLTAEQLRAANAMILGTHDRLDTAPRMHSNTPLEEIYRGIFPSQKPVMRAAKPNNWATAQGRVYDPSWWPQQQPAVIPGPDGYLTADKDTSRLDSPALAAYGEVPPPNAVQNAIAAALAAGPRVQPGMFGRGLPSMQWDPVAPSGPAPEGDPWAGMRYGGDAAEGPNAEGMVTGNRPVMQAARKSPVMRPGPSVRELTDLASKLVAQSDPRRGEKIMTSNNGEQTVGTRLNNSNRGYTITGDSWLNSVSGL